MRNGKKYKLALQNIDCCEDFYKHTLDYWKAVRESCDSTNIHECYMKEIDAEILYYTGGLQAIETVKRHINQQCEKS